VAGADDRREARHEAPPLYFTDHGGREWRVYDACPGPGGRPRVCPPGDARATRRIFVRPDGWSFGADVGRDPTDLSPAALRRQLAAALAAGPRRRRGESEAAYRERFQEWDAGYGRRGY
jgi:hypothetical protein